jgi:hypothetical protein
LHVEPHCLPLQVAAPFAGASHTALQAPQLFGSRLMSMQRESHLAKLELHSKLHFDATHWGAPLLGTGHAVPHAPQLFAETAVSTQAPEQLVVPAPQDDLQLPPEQTRPGPQAVVQAPQ